MSQPKDVFLPFAPHWMKFAFQELGVTEIKSNQHEAKILEYHATTTLSAQSDEVAWCSSFVNWVMKQAGIKGTGLASARSWLNWGTAIKTPAFGCVAVFKRGKEPWQGHVGFVVYESANKLMILGGNQGNKVSIAPYDKKDLLGYRFF